MARKTELLIYARKRWEIARVEVNTITRVRQWVRRDGSYIVDVGQESATADLPKAPKARR